MPGDEIKAQEAGCSGYITNQINTRTFLETVKKYLNHQPVAPSPAPQGLYRHKNLILVVDDDPMNVKLLSAKLPANQFNTIQAYNGEEAVRRAIHENPDLILLDIMMPEMDGYEVSHRLKTNPATENIPIILVTALDGADDKIRGFESGADEFLNKPVNDIELLTRIHSLLRLKHYREQLLSRTLSEKKIFNRAALARSFGGRGPSSPCIACRRQRKRRLNDPVNVFRRTLSSGEGENR